MAATSTLQDDFEWGTVDTGKWATTGDGNQVTETQQYLHITHTAAGQYNTLLAATTYNLTGSYIYSNVKNAGDQTITSHEVIMGIQLDANNKVWIVIGGGNVSAYKLVASVQSQIGSSVAYSSTTHAWLRIIEASGTISFDTSANGTTWTNRWTLANPFAITAIKPYLQSGCWQDEPKGSFGDFDNFNLASGALQFSWKGYTWNKRIQTGDSMYNGQWLSSNVSVDSDSGYLILSVSNAGASPYGAEIFSSQRGFGYGTYTFTVGTALTGIHRALVMGGLFTFDFTKSPDYREIDVGEVKDYNGNTNMRILKNHVWDNSGATFITDDADVNSAAVQTHRMIWLPSGITFDSFVGSDTSGTAYFTASQTTHLPVPGQERLHLNVWVQNANTPSGATATDFTIRNFTFNRLRTPSGTRSDSTTRSAASRSAASSRTAV